MKLLLHALAILVFSTAPLSAAPRYLGPTDLVAGTDPDVLYVLEKDAARIRRLHVADTSTEKAEFLDLPFAPERMRIFPDRKRLAVVGGGIHGRLLIVDTEPLRIATEIVLAGHTPCDVAIHQPTDAAIPVQLFVAQRFSGTVARIRLHPDGKTESLETRAAGREPIALVVTPDGKRLVVAGHLPEDESLRYDISSRVRILDVDDGQNGQIEKGSVLRLLPGTMNLRDVVLSPDGRFAFVTGLLGHFEHSTDSVGGGWMNENILYVIDTVQRELVATQSLDEYAVGSANPWGISLSDDARFLVVAAAGSCDVILLHLDKLLRPFRTTGPLRGLDAELPVRMRIPVAMKGVRHAVMVGGRVFATAYFEDCVAKIVPVFTEPTGYVSGILPKDRLELPRRQPWKLRLDNVSPARTNLPAAMQTSPSDAVVAALLDSVDERGAVRFFGLPDFSIASGIRFQRGVARLGPEPTWTAIRYGEMLFHDAIVCEEHWQSCSSCHPDGRTDTLNWDLLNDGPDNAKNTKSLLLSHETPPSMATGVRATAELAVRKGFETILMIPASEEEASAVDAYLTDLRPLPSPHLVVDPANTTDRGRLSEAARRGRRLFHSDRVGCALCHPEPLFTDMRKTDVGSRTSLDAEAAFDTPSLVEVWRTSPYLHDGRYATVRQLIVDGRHVDRDGRLDRLTDREIDDLVEYVLSL